MIFNLVTKENGDKRLGSKFFSGKLLQRFLPEINLVQAQFGKNNPRSKFKSILSDKM